MKKLSIFIILSLCFGFFSCKKLTAFKIHNSSDISIPSSPVAGLVNTPPVPVTSSANSSFQANGTDASHVKEIKLDQLSLTMKSAGDNFDFVDKIHLYISAPGLQQKEIAYLDPVPHNGSLKIDLTSTGVVLDDYVKKDSYSISVATTTNAIKTQDVNMTADMTFSVRATLHK
jgi:hypothetical protein